MSAQKAPTTVGITFDFGRKRFFLKPLFVTGRQALLSSIFAGVASRTIASPFEVVQTLAQVASKEGRKSYDEMVDDLYNKEGISVFFRGNIIGCIRYFGTSFLNIATFAGISYLLRDKETNILKEENFFLASSLSSILSSLATYPLEVIRTRMILDVHQKKYEGAIDCLMSTVSQEGASALFKGAIPFAIGHYILEDALERIWNIPGALLNTADFVQSVLAAVVATTLYYPLDTCLKMVQAPTVYKKLRPDVEFTNTFDAGLETINKHGLMSLWRGYPVAVMKIIPSTIAAVIGFEGAKRLFDYINSNYGFFETYY